MIIILLLMLIVGCWISIAEVWFERDWPRDTYPAVVWPMLFLIAWITTVQ